MNRIDISSLEQVRLIGAERSGLRKAALIFSTNKGVFQLNAPLEVLRDTASAIMRDLFGVDTSELTPEQWDEAWHKGQLWYRWLQGDPEAFRRPSDTKDPD